MFLFFINWITTHKWWHVSEEQLLKGHFLNTVVSEPRGLYLARSALLAVAVSFYQLNGGAGQVHFITYNELTQLTISIGKPYQNQNG